MRLPPRPMLDWKPDGTPVDTRTDDVYYSVDDGLAESRAIFLEAIGAPEIWQNRDGFTIGELGFGTGLNFLATWQLWQRSRPDRGWLHFVSFEGFPLDREDAAQALSRWPEVAALSGHLLQAWPVRAAGTHHLSWPRDRISLTLHIGPVRDCLDASELAADAWFLDGFSPARNEDMWLPSLWPELVQRSRPEAQIATFTVAGAVRRGLSDAGFRVEKRPGYGRKRERLWGCLQPGLGVPPGRTPEAGGGQGLRVGICGAGIGGVWLARCLRDRGAEVTLFDPAAAPFSGASGNPAALVMPRLDATDTPVSRLMIEAYLAAQRAYAGRPGCDPVSVRHLPESERARLRFARILEDPPLGLDQLEALPGSALLHKGAVLVRPDQLARQLLEGVDTRFGAPVEIVDARRRINDCAFDVLVLASGMAVGEAYRTLSLEPRLGQVDFFRSPVEAPPSAIASGHYALAVDDLRLWGATFEAHSGGQVQTSLSAQAANASALEGLAPYWVGESRRAALSSRAGVRATTPDRQPVLGPAPDEAVLPQTHAVLRHGGEPTQDVPRVPGVYLATGFGSRGFTWAPWGAQLITAQIFGDPLPVSRASRDLVAPERQALRALKRGTWPAGA